MSRRQPVSIAAKLTRMNMLVCGAALLLACFAFLAYDLSSFRETIVRNLSTEAQVAGSNSVSALLFDDAGSAQRTLAAFQAAPNIISARIYTADRKLFANYLRDSRVKVPPGPQTFPDQTEKYWMENDRLMLVHTISFEGKLAGFIFIETDLRALKARLLRYVVIAAIVMLLSLAAAFWISRMARGAIADPVIRLAEVARHVSREKIYSVRAAAGKEEGELAELVRTFNEMLETIEDRDRSLQEGRDQLERRVEERTAQLAAANNELESFSYSVSHDLRAPLRSIDGFSQALDEDYGDKLDDQGRHLIQRVRAATQRMGVLIDDLLNLSRVTRAAMHQERIDLSGMARTVASDLVNGASDRKVEWVIKSGVEAMGDTRLLRVVMDNLIGNAWKYTSKHEHARIEFGQQNGSGNCIYFVRDDGAGFDPAYSERLFGAFQRLHGMTEFPGTGVGLATVQRIILRHGGKIWAESAVEKGATFYFTLNASANGGRNGN
jgi:signal transduction histidine kinase